MENWLIGVKSKHFTLVVDIEGTAGIISTWRNLQEFSFLIQSPDALPAVKRENDLEIDCDKGDECT